MLRPDPAGGRAAEVPAKENGAIGAAPLDAGGLGSAELFISNGFVIVDTGCHAKGLCTAAASAPELRGYEPRIAKGFEGLVDETEPPVITAGFAGGLACFWLSKLVEKRTLFAPPGCENSMPPKAGHIFKAGCSAPAIPSVPFVLEPPTAASLGDLVVCSSNGLLAIMLESGLVAVALISNGAEPACVSRSISADSLGAPFGSDGTADAWGCPSIAPACASVGADPGTAPAWNGFSKENRGALGGASLEVLASVVLPETAA